MDWRSYLLAGLAALSVVAGVEPSLGDEPKVPHPKEAFQPLFNGRDLTGWYTFLQQHGKGSDPDHIVTVEDGAIHLYKHAAEASTVVMGYIATEREFGDYHIRFQYRWGAKKFQPRLALKRDAGFYYHILGPDQVWPQALQYQVEQTNVGDLITLYGFQVDTWSDPKTIGHEMPTYLGPDQGGRERIMGGKGLAYQKHLAGDVERDGWNTAEVIAKGDTVVHVLNGHVINQARNVRLVEAAKPGAPRPITRGRIALEIEAAEIYFRNVEIRTLAAAGDLQSGAAAANLVADDSLVIGGGIGPHKVVGQEGELRASAVVIQDPEGGKVALIACDVLMVNRDVLDVAARRIERELGIPFDHILINATHTHSAPTTVSIHGYRREEAFTQQVGKMVFEAAAAASKRLGPVTMLFRLGEESSVGRNSRLLLSDGTVFWTGSPADAVRPTGPFDPELPVWAFRRPDGALEAVLFNHSTHTIGTVKPNVRSPSFYGLAAQGLEKERGGTFLFFEGASGSTHNLDLLAPEMTYRISQAVTAALAAAQPRPVDRVRGVRSEFAYKVRRFDEAADEKAVVDYCSKRIKDPTAAKFTIGTFRDMRKELAPHRGEERKTWIQAITIGDTAVVGVPGEFFTVLGEDIKRRSPFRYTYVFELSNDYIGYVADRKGYELGGYQTWTGLHSFLEPGTGEEIVAESVKLLDRLHDEAAATGSP